MIVTRPIRPEEPDLLKGSEAAPLHFMSCGHKASEVKIVLPPDTGWTHEALEAVEPPHTGAWDAYLGDTWVGSSEV